MQPIWLARVFFVLVMTWSGFYLGRQSGKTIEFSAVGFMISIFFVVFEHSSRVLSTKKVALGFIGAFFGLAFGRLFAPAVPLGLFPGPDTQTFVISLVFMYFGIVTALRQADRISLSRLRFFIGAASENSVLLDTSVIIDGRITKLYRSGFMSRSCIVPSFVLDELQALADSRDPEKRNYGRRGLDHLEELRSVDRGLQVFEKDYGDVRGGVDHKLILLAKEIGATIISNDYNLCRVAGVHHVKTLNVNELAAATRINLSVGDQVALVVQREGREEAQGVGHLDDGTMVVVDRGRQFLGQQIHVVVTSIMQTSAGRLAFARPLEQRVASRADDDPVRKDVVAREPERAEAPDVTEESTQSALKDRARKPAAPAATPATEQATPPPRLQKASR